MSTQILRSLGYGTLGSYIKKGVIVGELDHLDFGGDGDGDGDGDSAEVEVTVANGASEAFPANAIPTRCVVKLVEVFAGGTIDSATLTAGDTGNVDQILGETPINVFTGQALGFKFATGDDNAADGTQTFEAAWVPVFAVTTGTEPPAGLTSGKFKYWLEYEQFVEG